MLDKCLPVIGGKQVYNPLPGHWNSQSTSQGCYGDEHQSILGTDIIFVTNKSVCEQGSVAFELSLKSYKKYIVLDNVVAIKNTSTRQKLAVHRKVSKLNYREK